MTVHRTVSPVPALGPAAGFLEAPGAMGMDNEGASCRG